VIWIAILFGLVFLGVVVYSSMGLKRYRVEACMEFEGRTACRTASAATEEQARRTAIENACALIASGMTESVACSSSRPRSIRRVE
jgi:hypothetical protein